MNALKFIPIKTFLFLALFFITASSHAELVLAENGEANCVILVDPAATAPERNAADELAATLRQITGASFAVRTNGDTLDRAILIGSSEAARRV